MVFLCVVGMDQDFALRLLGYLAEEVMRRTVCNVLKGKLNNNHHLVLPDTQKVL
jgi:hypothetical protein